MYWNSARGKQRESHATRISVFTGSNFPCPQQYYEDIEEVIWRLHVTTRIIITVNAGEHLALTRREVEYISRMLKDLQRCTILLVVYDTYTENSFSLRSVLVRSLSSAVKAAIFRSCSCDPGVDILVESISQGIKRIHRGHGLARQTTLASYVDVGLSQSKPSVLRCFKLILAAFALHSTKDLALLLRFLINSRNPAPPATHRAFSAPE
ncbi:hypothetical protein C8R43DRAFT_943519 [Mycena crocata]|nr:hypothetical protein C8R43DRAFT_943519 [Mycena crocata]